MLSLQHLYHPMTPFGIAAFVVNSAPERGVGGETWAIQPQQLRPPPAFLHLAHRLLIDRLSLAVQLLMRAKERCGGGGIAHPDGERLYRELIAVRRARHWRRHPFTQRRQPGLRDGVDLLIRAVPLLHQLMR